MKKTLLSLLAIAGVLLALNDATVPNTFTANTPAVSSEVNENFDSLEIAINRVVDTLGNDFVRYSDFDSSDTNFDKLWIDTGYFETVSISDSVYAAKITTAAAIITTADLNGGTIDGTTIGATSATTGVFTTLNTGQGANELYDMDQNVLTTSDVTFDSVAVTTGVTTVTLDASGAITSTTLNTGQGANELYDMDQNVLTTSAPTFATINTGEGANELYDMDQNVLTTSDVIFDSIATTSGATFAGNVGIGLAPTYRFHTEKVGDSNPNGFDCYAVSPDAYSYIVFRKSKSNTKADVTTESGDGLGGSIWAGNSGSGFTLGASILAVQVGTASTYTPTKLVFGTSNGTTAYNTKLEISPSGDIYTKELASGVTPASGYGNWYCKTDNLPYFKGDGGTEHSLIVNGATITPDSVNVTKGIVATALNTGQGLNELYDMDQNVLTTSDVIFDSIATTSGVTIGGNVGIGIAAAASIFGFRLYEPSSTGAYNQWMNSTTGTGSSDGFVLGIDNNEDAVLINNEATRMAFATTGVERMAISAVGDLFTRELASGATPDSSFGNWYAKTDGLPYFKNDAGTEYSLGLNATFKAEVTYLGWTAPITDTLEYSIFGNVVILSLPYVAGTSNANTVKIAGIPEAIRFAVGGSRTYAVGIGANGTEHATYQIEATDTIHVVGVTAAWPASGTNTVSQCTITYSTTIN